MRMFDYDPIDKHLHRLIKNWAMMVPLPANGKESLYLRIRQPVPEVPVHLRILRVSWWIVRNMILLPLDYLLTPVLYSAEDDIHNVLLHSRLDLSLAVRAMTNDTLSHGMEIFTYIT